MNHIISDKSNDNSARITMIGTSGVGKTCFLAGLARLGSDAVNSTLNLNPIDENSRKYFQNLSDNIRTGQIPEATSINTTLGFKLTIHDETREYKIIDYRGEDYQNTAHKGTEFDQKFLEHLWKSGIIMVFIDAEDIESVKSTDDEEETHRIIEKLKDSIDGITNAYDDYSRDTNEPEPKHREVCVVLTKADVTDDTRNIIGSEKDVKHYINRHLKNFEKNLQNSLVKISRRPLRYFAISSLWKDNESLSNDASPDNTEEQKTETVRINPKGYDLLLDWIGERPDRIRIIGIIEKIKKLLLIIGGLVFLVLLTVATYYAYRAYIKNNQLALIDDHRSTIEDVVSIKPVNDVVRAKQSERWTSEYGTADDYKNRIQTYDIEFLDSERDKLLKMEDACFNNTLKENIRELKGIIRARKEEVLFSQIKHYCKDKDRKALVLIDVFLGEYPGSVHKEVVGKLKEDLEKSIVATNRNNVRAVEVKDNASLGSKIKEINRFLGDSDNTKQLGEDEIKNITNAVKLAEQFSSGDNQHTVVIKSYGSFMNHRGNEVKLVIKRNGEPIYQHKPNGDIIGITPKEEWKFQGKFGDQYVIELYADPTVFGGPRIVAKYETKDISIFGAMQKLIATLDGKDFCGEKGYYVSSELDGISEDDIQAFRDYVYPGDKW